jgi:hypothetical protein
MCKITSRAKELFYGTGKITSRAKERFDGYIKIQIGQKNLTGQVK